MGKETNQRGRGDSNSIYPLEMNPTANRAPPPSAPSKGDYKPFRQWFPWLVPTFIVANVALFIITMFVNDCPGNVGADSCVLRRLLGRFAFQPLRENPLLGPSSTTLLKMGALEVNRVVRDHQRWRLITCIWLHAGVVHILANMLSLLLIGIKLEKEFGFVRIGLLYVISGIGGSLLSALFMQSSISVGASGALFGLLGSMLSELITNWTIYANKFAALLTLVFIIAINLAVGILPHVDNFAHIGGFITGFFLGFVILIRPQFKWISQKSAPLGYHSSPVKHKHKMYQYVLWVIAAIVLIVGFILGLVMLFRGVNMNEHCSWCHYLSCVPTSKWSCKSQTQSCLSSLSGNQLNLTCQGSGKTQTYWLDDSKSNSTNLIYQMCVEFCS
ncbi:RHOMBOID-like protein 2 [Ananas comosus]|uniref:RHOMBOID-like protein n=2 Tax=Ananas comosus TaxID=4615 RepID=A0A6P5EUE5_ANACO|nr:RHOMBOID-like protein 2 [Ananas comosus]CAD1828685.1 unnamed protein product [Ananas comosus var. bracteatus]